jgi:hypothetical protein
MWKRTVLRNNPPSADRSKKEALPDLRASRKRGRSLTTRVSFVHSFCAGGNELMPQTSWIRRLLSPALGICSALSLGCLPIVRPSLSDSSRLGPGGSAQLLTTQIIVWNRIAQPAKLEVVLDDSLVYSGLISVAKIPDQVGGGRVIQIPPGQHKLQARDATRGLFQDTVFVSDPAHATASQVITIRIEPSGPRITIGSVISP